MKYLSVTQIAKKWNVTGRTVRNYCNQGLIEGAFLTGKTWNIPEDAQKPLRKKKLVPISTPLLDRLRKEKTGHIKGGIYHKVQIELTYNSNRIEGSKLSIEQTRLIFETLTIGLENTALPVDDIIETVNHFRAIDYVINNAEKPIRESLIKEFHRIIKSSTSDSMKEWFAVGDYKKLPNEVAGFKTVAPEKVSKEIFQLISAYETRKNYSVENIIEFHVAFERIHPFQDGNGRVGRLLMFKECLRHGIVPFIISDELKAFYYRGLNNWSTETGYLIDTCLAAQDVFKSDMDYFRI